MVCRLLDGLAWSRSQDDTTDDVALGKRRVDSPPRTPPTRSARPTTPSPRPLRGARLLRKKNPRSSFNPKGHFGPFAEARPSAGLGPLTSQRIGGTENYEPLVSATRYGLRSNLRGRSTCTLLEQIADKTFRTSPRVLGPG